VVHGWILKGPNFYTIEYPGASSTQLTGMNAYGKLVGVANPNGGFEYDQGSRTYTAIGYPGATYPPGLDQ
jgi:hypothetical protein